MFLVFGAQILAMHEIQLCRSYFKVHPPDADTCPFLDSLRAKAFELGTMSRIPGGALKFQKMEDTGWVGSQLEGSDQS